MNALDGRDRERTAMPALDRKREPGNLEINRAPGICLLRPGRIKEACKLHPEPGLVGQKGIRLNQH